jgi:mannitol/fructose-specific phosphotransferase system IIA component (Ntr-type)
MKLFTLLKKELIRINCRGSNTEEILKEMSHDLKVKEIIPDEEAILKKLMEREKMGSTSIGNKSAVPHTKLKELKDPVISIGISKKGIKYHKDDKEPVHFIILILSPNNAPIIHLQILAAAAALIKKSDRLIKELLSSETPEELIDIIRKFEVSDE